MASDHWHSRQPELAALSAINELRTYRLMLDSERRRVRRCLALHSSATAETQALLRAQELELGDEVALLEELIDALAAGFGEADPTRHHQLETGERPHRVQSAEQIVL